MANLDLIRENRLRAEMMTPGTHSWSCRSMLYFLGFNLLAGYVYAPLLCVTLGVTLFAVIVMSGVFAPGPSQILVAGADGEDYTLSLLSELPDDYAVLNQLVVPDPTSAYGRREIDFVVVGPGGLFVVECKNYRGLVSGGEYDGTWRLDKVGRQGTPYASEVTNPVRQVRKQVAALNKHLAASGVQASVVPLVAMAANNDASAVRSPSVPVLPAVALTEHILAAAGARMPDARVMEVLRHLRDLPFHDPLPQAA